MYVILYCILFAFSNNSDLDWVTYAMSLGLSIIFVIVYYGKTWFMKDVVSYIHVV